MASNRFAALLLAAMLCAIGAAAHADTLAATVAAVKPSIVGIGTLQRTRTPPVQFIATGFVTGDGLSVITAAHAVPLVLDVARMETLGIITGRGDQLDFRPVTVKNIDREHDLVHLRLMGAPLPALRIDDGDRGAEGQSLAFTGFPLGMALGMVPVTHRATLAAITPVVQPIANSRSLDARTIRQLQRPFSLFQLDGTAYPGNSGSPLYDPETGVVFGVVNSAVLKGLKESAISQPSGITYAIPARYIRELMDRI
ncbi:S1 family peptidase [Massilia endophytica]|uniref:S1 family peptidase n=1 Tax=Massilia endophytica TaxID=2899220 RepID=UPI001E57768C|nr:serine protease [Massilia endophytica]UGQ46218.1 serine protease [Massilia endophytica]